MKRNWSETVKDKQVRSQKEIKWNEVLNCKNCFFRSIHFHLRLKKTHIRMRGIGEFHSRLVLLRSTNTVIRKLSHVQLIAIFHPNTRISWHLVLFLVINEYIRYKWKFKVQKLHVCKFIIFYIISDNICITTWMKILEFKFLN